MMISYYYANTEEHILMHITRIPDRGKGLGRTLCRKKVAVQYAKDFGYGLPYRELDYGVCATCFDVYHYSPNDDGDWQESVDKLETLIDNANKAIKEMQEYTDLQIMRWSE